MKMTGKTMKLTTLKKGKASDNVQVTKKSANVIIDGINFNAYELSKVEHDIIALAEAVQELEKGLAYLQAVKPLLEQLQVEAQEKKAAEMVNYLKGGDKFS